MIKQFSTLAAARKWLQMPASRMYCERDLCKVKKEPASQSSEFFAVKGGSLAGVYKTMADAIHAKDNGGGAFAFFTSESEALAFVKQKQVFVVWAGRAVGVMDRDQCIKATQHLPNTKMRGPMQEDAAEQLWESLQSNAQVVQSAAADTPATPKKKNTKT